VARPPIILRVRSAVRESISTFFSRRDIAMILSICLSSVSIGSTSPGQLLIYIIYSSPLNQLTSSTDLLKVCFIFFEVIHKETHVFLVDLFLQTGVTHSISDGLLFVDSLREEQRIHFDWRSLLHAFRQFIEMCYRMVKDTKRINRRKEGTYIYLLQA